MTLLYPLDLCKRRMMLAGINGFPEYHNFIVCMLSTIHNEGFSGLYKGITMAYWKVVPAVALTFFTYETILTLFNKI